MALNQFAERIAASYIQKENVEAVLLGGSVARGWQDEHSDIELYVCWKKGPSDEDRLAVIQTFQAEILDFHPYEEEEWSESYIVDGVKLEISNFLSTTIAKIVANVDTDLDKQCIVATVHDGKALEGKALIESWKAALQDYPKELQIAMIEEAMDLGNRWNNRRALVDREDWLMLYSVMTDVQRNMMRMLAGINGLYIQHPAFKWQKHSIQAMPVKPDRLSERVEKIWLDHPSKAIRELEALIRDTYTLVEEYFPEIDATKGWRSLEFVRPKQKF